MKQMKQKTNFNQYKNDLRIRAQERKVIQYDPDSESFETEYQKLETMIRKREKEEATPMDKVF